MEQQIIASTIRRILPTFNAFHLLGRSGSDSIPHR